MKAIFVIALIACAFASEVVVDSENLYELFQSWKAEYNFNFENAEEDAYRFAVFTANYNFIQSYNAMQSDVVLGLNQFAHMTSEEFGAFVKGINANTAETLQNNFETISLDEENIESSINWVEKGAVTDIKNQEQCGGCWAFAAAASLESLYFLQGNTLTSFSPQQLIDCATECDGCNGCDTLYNALEYTEKNGIEALTSYPITDVTGKCKYNSADVVVKNSGYTNVQPKSAAQLQAALNQQPTIVGIQASQNVFQLYKSGVIKTGCGDQVDHAVTAVGYGTEDSTSAFLIKNSWGATWGMEGYVWIANDESVNGGTGVCGIFTMPVYPTKI